jgi:UDP-N-acetylglucosamine 2-epimerase (non-hydrolysing)
VNPDALLVLGDTNSGLSVLSAKRLKIPVFHLEAGNRCFDENLPEEINRRLIDHASDINLCYTEHARRYLMQEGRPMERTFVVGSPMLEVINSNINKIRNSDVLKRLNLSEKKYIILSAHREENIDNEITFNRLLDSINCVADEFKVTIVYSVHPRTKKALEKMKFVFSEKIKFLEPLSFTDYMALQINALAVLSDSGTLAEEASKFKFPAISLRNSTERPEALDNGTMILGNTSSESIIQAINLARCLHKEDRLGSCVKDYETINFGMKIVNIIQSYTLIINQLVWNK